MQLIMNILVFTIWLPKGEKERKGKGYRSSKCLGRYFHQEVQWEEVQWWLPTFVCTSVIRDSYQRSQNRSPKFGGQSPFFPTWLHHAVFRLFQEHRHSCLPCGWGWGKGCCYRAKSWSWLKLIAIDMPMSSPGSSQSQTDFSIPK